MREQVIQAYRTSRQQQRSGDGAMPGAGGKGGEGGGQQMWGGREGYWTMAWNPACCRTFDTCLSPTQGRGSRASGREGGGRV